MCPPRRAWITGARRSRRAWWRLSFPILISRYVSRAHRGLSSTAEASQQFSGLARHVVWSSVHSYLRSSQLFFFMFLVLQVYSRHKVFVSLILQTTNTLSSCEEHSPVPLQRLRTQAYPRTHAYPSLISAEVIHRRILRRCCQLWGLPSVATSAVMLTYTYAARRRLVSGHPGIRLREPTA